jgi:hypothetical protein
MTSFSSCMSCVGGLYNPSPSTFTIYVEEYVLPSFLESF